MSLPRRYIEAQLEEEKRKLRERMEQVPADLPGRYPQQPPALAEQSNVIDFPTRNPRPDAEVPLDLPNYDLPRRYSQDDVQVLTPQNQQAVTRPRTATPPETAAAEDVSETLPTRPRLVYPKGTVEYQDRLVTDLESTPPEKMSRKKSSLYGFLRGLRTGGLGAGAVGAIVGAIAPGATAEMKQRDEVAKASAKLDTAIQREGKLSVIDERRRQPQKEYEAALRTEREKRIANLMTMHDRAGHYNPDDPNDRSSQIIKAQAVALGVADQLIPYTKADRTPPTKEIDGVVFERQADGNWTAAKGLPSRAMVNVPGYGPMTPAQARQADATAGERVYQRGRDTKLDERHDQERAEQRRQAASRIAGDVATHNANAAKLQDFALKTKDPAMKEYAESEMLGEKEKANAKALELRQGYGDIYEAGPGEGGWAYVKPKEQPSRPLPTRGAGRKGRNSRTYTVDTSKYGLP